MRVRHRAHRVSGKAAPDPELSRRLQAARLYVITPDVPLERVIEIATSAVRGGADAIQLETLSPASRLYEFAPDVVVILNAVQSLRAAYAGRDGEFAQNTLDSITAAWDATHIHAPKAVQHCLGEGLDLHQKVRVSQLRHGDCRALRRRRRR